MPKVLVVDDKLSLCESLVANFENHGYQAAFALQAEAAFECLNRDKFDVMLLDVKLGDDDGIDVLQKALVLQPELIVIMMTAFATVESAVEAMRLGAKNYLRKPVRFNAFLELLRDVGSSEKNANSESASKSVKVQYHAPAMSELYAKARMIANSDIPVLVCGESGTGKELLVEYIHANSQRKGREIQKINCAAFPESLLDNELFGHEKGAYTGADQAFQGVFERSDRSTLFLDEIGDMPLTIQAKILRVLQEQEFRRIGGKELRKVDIRFIAATNKDLPAMVAQKEFREDLYYRLNSAKFQLPPLRERRSEISQLANYFLSNFDSKAQTVIHVFNPEVLTIFENYRWPGNVRELKNVVQYAASICNGSNIGKEHLPEELGAKT